MNKSKIIVIKVKKTERTIYDFNILKLDLTKNSNRDKIIDDYVIYYLKALKEVCETIIFVSDCNLEASETSKLDNIADFDMPLQAFEIVQQY